jgi:DNA-binding CsgD family transcriptional regulator
MPKQLQNTLMKFSEDLARKGDPFEKFDAFLKDFGVKGFSYGFAVLRAEMAREDRTKSVFFTHNFSHQWEDEIGSGPFLDLDPAIDQLMGGAAIYEWAPPDLPKLLQDLPKLQRRQIEAELDMGMNYGVTLPLMLGRTGFSGMGLWFENLPSADAFRKEWAEFGPTLMKAGHLLDSYVRKDHPNLMVGLSAREIECLNLLLGGYRANEICFQLGISEKTLEKHILHARTKLKAHTRDQALAKAILMGLIKL